MRVHVKPTTEVVVIESRDEGEGAGSARVETLLDREAVVWLSTVRPDGRPHLIPIWFWWDGIALLFASKPQACKVANLRSRADCMIAIGDPTADFDVALIEARAELAPMTTIELLAAGMLAKYCERMQAAGLSSGAFAATYSQVVRIVPTRWLPWHGRTERTPWRHDAEGVGTAQPWRLSAAELPVPTELGPRVGFLPAQ
jgi:PPOX class probable F420-dependent enzyme